MTEKADSKSENHVPDDIITFDVILQEVGEFGRYQILSGILTCLSITLSTCALFNFVFSAAVPDHRLVHFHSILPNSINQNNIRIFHGQKGV